MGEKIQSATTFSGINQTFFYRSLWNKKFGPITSGMIAAHESILHMLKISKMLTIQALRKTSTK
jgi:hypothetical protein